MRRLNFTAAAFSLVEVTLAMGVAAFCLIAVFGLMPVGVQTNRNAISQTAATNILSSVVSDIRASPKGTGASVQYGIRRSKGNITTVCFDGQGVSTPPQPSNAPCPGGNSRYRLYVRIYPISAQLPYLASYAYLKVVWPAAVDPLSPTIPPSGSVETVATFFAN
jgi:type II secretory pathway pseudopilin PulG